MTSDKTYHEVRQDLAREWRAFWWAVEEESLLLYYVWRILLWPVTRHLPKIDQKGAG